MSERIPLNDLSRAAHAQAGPLQERANAVIASGWFVHGPNHRSFEKSFAEYLNVAHVLGVASGTDALEIALRAAASPARNTVITVANAGGYTSTAATAAGLALRYVDIAPDTHLLDPTKLGGLLDESVAAVVVTHLYGRLADVAAVKELCSPFGIKVIEDCAQAHGARTEVGAMAGALGDLATFSFYPTKNLGALGDGGAISTNDPVLAQKVSHLRQYGWERKYRVEHAGARNSRLDEIQAAFLLHRLPLLDEANSRRRAIINRYAAVENRLLRVLPAEGENHVGHLAIVETDHVEALRHHLDAAGIATDVHFPVPDHLQTAWKQDISLPVTESMCSRILTVPNFPELTDDEVNRVADVLGSFTLEDS